MTAKRTTVGTIPAKLRLDGTRALTLADVDPDADGGFPDKDAGKAALKIERQRIRELQERLYADHRQSLLVVFQATDSGGKDGVIEKVFGGVNPQGVHVASFKEPTSIELDHDPLWRYHMQTPGRGLIGVFNRSQYEEVLVVRVKGLVPEAAWSQRYDQINAFEQNLAENGTRILKFFLHISREEQKERLQARLDDPNKIWKFSKGDLKDREQWAEYQRAFEDAINRCATPQAPWFVVPANRKWYRNYVVARTVADTLEAMNPRFPPPEEGLDTIVILD